MKDRTISEDKLDLIRNGFGFKYFFNAGLNKDTMECDEEGSDVFVKREDGKWHFEDTFSGVKPSELENMTEEEFEEKLLDIDW